MTKLIETQTRLEAWVAGTRHLMENGPTLNMILSIAAPRSDGPLGKVARDSLNELYAELDQYPVHTVAETIFPGWAYQRKGLEAMFESYLAEYDAIKERGDGDWGRYAERLMRRKDAEGKVYNPLERLIGKMRRQTELRGPQSSCYEIGIAEGEFELPLYKAETDSKRTRGGPCLSHLSFKLFQQKVHLTATYRSHDYRFKVPGNLLGLARLQDCVAQEVGVDVGELVVHSTYAYLESGKGKDKLRAVVLGLAKALAEKK